MENILQSNDVSLAGRVLTGPLFNHKTYGEAFYAITLGIFRRSGYEDKIKLLISERLLGGRSPREGELLEVRGQVRTYNKEKEGRNKLEITVFVHEMSYCRREGFTYENIVCLEGFICKEPIHRTSPLGREICDMMIAVNRLYNKSDYIPSIAWGRNATFAGSLSVGDKVAVEGRLQSREYRKYTEEGQMTVKTAYEVSVGRVERLQT
ncbi:MAG: single-stranded DNA-binding protein [Clostridiales bacterium]|nr:single-stranded DNA-binding protein [Clostridiales bacterium]